MRRKRSFFEKITGTVNLDDDFDPIEEEVAETTSLPIADENPPERGAIYNEPMKPEEPEEQVGQLAVDVRENDKEIVIQAMVAGVKHSDLHIDISFDSVTITGVRERNHRADDDLYHNSELFWGSFSRSIALPEEIEIETARAAEKHGLLTIHLPKIDKKKKIRVNVASE